MEIHLSKIDINSQKLPSHAFPNILHCQVNISIQRDDLQPTLFVLKIMSHFRLILNTGLALLSILNVASGDVRIVNNLGCPLYLQSVSNVAGPLQTPEANGGR